MAHAYAGYPSAFVFETPDGKRTDHLLWGDYINVLGPEQDGWLNVRARGTTGWIRKDDTQEDALLEINFVDIGQGDGCFVVTPNGKFILIDAGEGDNMYRFLRWRFNLKKHPERIIGIESAIISHPDSDHYRGFLPLFKSEQFLFDAVYHNGLIERDGADALGAVEKFDGENFVTGVIEKFDVLKALTGNPSLVGGSGYAKLMKIACDGGRVKDIRMLCADDGFLPGYGEGESDLVVRVLGPVTESPNGGRCLRWFEDKGKTKNGHSVALKFEYGNVKIMLGGDLNIPAEEHLLRHYTGLDPRPRTDEEAEALVTKAQQSFRADVAKACHHGSADFTGHFLRAVNPIATIVSSGDNESHSHPRPDALGAFGKAGRGERPLIFSTELARSAKETIKDPRALRAEIEELTQLRAQASDDEAIAVKLDAKIHKLLEKIERTVSVYGLINLRTDGKNVVIAQKLEKAAPRGEWDIYTLVSDSSGELKLVSKFLS